MAENKHRPTSWRGTSADVDSDDLPFELTPKDKYILELNHQRLSYRKISQRLKLDHGIELSKSTVSRRLKELRQDPANDVQIQECSIPQKRREECKWYKIIERVRQAIIEYTELNDFKPSSRTMFYQMQDEGLVTKNEQSAFVKATVEARLVIVGILLNSSISCINGSYLTI